LHLLESATAPEEVEAAARQFRAWLKRLDLIDTGVVFTIASLANSKSGSAGAATRARRTHDPCSPSMPRYRGPNYDRKLSRALVLADGRRLVTLRAAVNVISDLLRSEDEHSDTLNQAIALLLVAANSGAPENVAAATDEAERVLRARRLLGGR
jgi:hypothetical protein